MHPEIEPTKPHEDGQSHGQREDIGLRPAVGLHTR